MGAAPVLTPFLRARHYTFFQFQAKEVIDVDWICLGVVVLFFGLSFGMVELLERLH
jgi:hypothetical protein